VGHFTYTHLVRLIRVANIIYAQTPVVILVIDGAMSTEERVLRFLLDDLALDLCFEVRPVLQNLPVTTLT
jgi:hypothetical protein